jgi:hypothetical protein
MTTEKRPIDELAYYVRAADALSEFLESIRLISGQRAVVRELLEREGKQCNLIVRLLLMEHFTVRVLGMSEEFYSFVTFKEAEKCICECDL